VHAHRFTVFVIPPADATDDELAQVERLARLATEAAKPAHTEADLVVVAPRLRVGRQATVGLDAVVGGVPAPAQLGARLGDGLVLGGAPVPARAAVVGHSRIGRDETVTGW